MLEFLIPVALVVVITIVTRRLNAQSRAGRPPGTPSPRVQRLLERMQAQQGIQPSAPQGQYTQPAAGPPASPYSHPGQYQPSQFQPGQFQPTYRPGQHQPNSQRGQFRPNIPPGQFQPNFLPGQYQPPTPWYPPPTQAQRAIQPKPSQRDLDSRVRDLMKAGNEVAAVRLLCDEQDLGIIDAQKRARSLVAPAGTANPTVATATGTATGDSTSDSDRASASSPAGENRYVGSAAFAQSLFDTNQDDKESWASGWIDLPEPGDRSDMDELWQTIRTHGRPGPR